jgi:hypothetical protein
VDQGLGKRTFYDSKFGLIEFQLMIFAGTTIIVVVSVVSSVVLLVVGGAIGFYIWKHRYIQKKRKGIKLFLERCGSHHAILLILNHSRTLESKCFYFMKPPNVLYIFLKWRKNFRQLNLLSNAVMHD